MNNPPFSIGQRVVCIDPVDIFKKNTPYTVAGNTFCKVCNRWHTHIEELPSYPSGIMRCCGVVYPPIYFMSAYSKRFAPIQPQKVKV